MNGSFEKISEQLSPVMENLREKRLFLTGATGFFGKWLLACLNYFNTKLDLQLQVTALSRNPDIFMKNYPEFTKIKNLNWIEGDIRKFIFPDGKYDFVIHSATESSGSLERDNPEDMFSVITDGTTRVLQYCSETGVKRLLFVSSGAVYGKQPSHISRLPEDFLESGDCIIPETAYGRGKIKAEQLCLQSSIPVIIARPFAFVGPYLPLNAHFAAGNFIRDALNRQPIVINGDGTPLRSYLYSTDLVYWLLAILLKGRVGDAYNVGSEEAVSIRELAETTAACVDYPLAVKVCKQPEPGQAPSRYIPDTAKARNELGLKQNFSLEQSIKSTISWYRKRF